MNPWTTAVDAIAEMILRLGSWLGGGPALGILTLTFTVRAALIPLLGPLAIRTLGRQRVVKRLRPQIKELHRELRDHPGTLSRELKALHRAHGINVVDWPGLAGALVQLPILIALFQAVLHVWEPEALTIGGTGLGLVSAGLSFFGTKVSGQSEGAPWMLWMSGGLPVAICLWLGTGIGLYLTGFYGAGAVQALLMPKVPTVEAPAPSD